jgi:hypothetical protein
MYIYYAIYIHVLVVAAVRVVEAAVRVVEAAMRVVKVVVCINSHFIIY